MDLVWNNLLTCDYERTRPGAPRLELDLYTRSLICWPHILMGDPRPYGHLRRPGIVDIPQPDHAALIAAWHQRLADSTYVRSLISQTAAGRKAADCQLDRVDQAISAGDGAHAAAAMSLATAAVLRVMSTHIVNWLAARSPLGTFPRRHPRRPRPGTGLHVSLPAARRSSATSSPPASSTAATPQPAGPRRPCCVPNGHPTRLSQQPGTPLRRRRSRRSARCWNGRPPARSAARKSANATSPWLAPGPQPRPGRSPPSPRPASCTKTQPRPERSLSARRPTLPCMGARHPRSPG